ncbi:hypothetical protein BDN72DRAFT_884333 [Pluteus cervinus]|uniref:Uncharacterized protein n=1 Tax=Pluteus cervinus TaxID=181527 RepID=A0ACD2ZWS0_9AGAR|nr:hypothetical protein BDN72DRAFT_884333 [Pluteus cervinus]
MSMSDALNILHGCSKLRFFSVTPSTDLLYQASATVRHPALPANTFLPHLTKFHAQAWTKLGLFLNPAMVPNLEELALKTPPTPHHEIDFLQLESFFKAPPPSLRAVYLQIVRHERIDEIIGLFHIPNLQTLTITCSHPIRTYSISMFEHATRVILKQLPQLHSLMLHYDLSPGSDLKISEEGNWKLDPEMGIHVRWMLAGVLILDTAHSNHLGATTTPLAVEGTWKGVPSASIFEEAWEGIPTYYDTSLFREPFTFPVPLNSQRSGCDCKFKLAKSATGA